MGLLRHRVVDLLAAGENDVFALDICLPEYDFGEILRVLDWMAERGEVIMVGECVELNFASPSYGRGRQVSLATAGGNGVNY